LRFNQANSLLQSNSENSTAEAVALPGFLARFKRFIPDPQVMRPVITVLRALIAAAIVVVVALKIDDIGWDQTLKALPRAPMFYVYFAVAYWILPLAELAIYRALWPIRWRSLPVFIRKRVYNELMFDYSGEAYLYLWAKQAVTSSSRGLLSTIKDVNLLSGVASNGLTLIMLPVVAFGGHMYLLKAPGAHPLVPLLICAVLAAALMLVLFLFRRKIFALSRRDALIVGAMHVTRLLIVFTLQIAQWSAALPQVPAAEWLMFLAAQLLLTRIPFLPNRDVMMTWVGVALAEAVAAPQAQVASMFLAAGTLSLATHGVMYLLISVGGLMSRKGQTADRNGHRPSQSDFLQPQALPATASPDHGSAGA
jgi:hypothetical protein